MLRCTSRSIVVLVVLAAVSVLTTGVALAKSKFFIQGAELTKQADGSWAGPGTLDGVRGKLTITGTIDLVSNEEPHTIHFRWKAGKRVVAGCSVNEILQRPHGVMLWEGDGRITTTSRKERKYQGLHVHLTGPTKSDDLTHAKLSVSSYTRSSSSPAVNC